GRGTGSPSKSVAGTGAPGAPEETGGSTPERAARRPRRGCRSRRSPRFSRAALRLRRREPLEKELRRLALRRAADFRPEPGSELRRELPARVPRERVAPREKTPDRGELRRADRACIPPR